MDKFKTEQI